MAPKAIRSVAGFDFLPARDAPTFLVSRPERGDMDREELLDAWQRNNDRPVWVREYRDELEAHIDTADPIPRNGSTAEIRRWLDRFKGTVTRQLNDDAEGTDPQDAEDTTSDDAEPEGES